MVDGVFVPNAKYRLKEALEEAKTTGHSGAIAVTAPSRLFCGATTLLDAIGEKLGITEDLKSCFPDSWREKLSIAYFLILEDRNPLSHFLRWAASHRHLEQPGHSAEVGEITKKQKALFVSLGVAVPA